MKHFQKKHWITFSRLIWIRKMNFEAWSLPDFSIILDLPSNEEFELFGAFFWHKFGSNSEIQEFVLLVNKILSPLLEKIFPSSLSLFLNLSTWSGTCTLLLKHFLQIRQKRGKKNHRMRKKQIFLVWLYSIICFFLENENRGLDFL